MILVLTTLGIGVVVLPVAGLASRVPYSSLVGLLTERSALEALRLSLLTSSLAALVATTLGVPVGWTLARRGDWWVPAARSVVLLPLVLPPVVAGVALLATFGRRGLLGGWLASVGIVLPFSTLGVVVAQTVVALPFVVITVEAGARSADRGLEEAAATCGADGWFTFRRVVLPLLRPSILAAAALAWARSLGEFGATVTFAGNVPGRTRTLPLAVVTELQRDPDAAVAISLLLVVVSAAVLLGLRDRWLGASG